MEMTMVDNWSNEAFSILEFTEENKHGIKIIKSKKIAKNSRNRGQRNWHEGLIIGILFPEILKNYILNAD